jgi:hypothetical protein
MLRFLLKIWPAFVPIAIYLLWVFVIKKYFFKKTPKEKIIDAEFEVVGENSKSEEKIFSLENKFFIIVIYSSLILAIITLILTAFSA